MATMESAKMIIEAKISKWFSFVILLSNYVNLFGILKYFPNAKICRIKTSKSITYIKVKDLQIFK